MHVCLICPIPNLVHYVDRGATHHLILSHLLDNSESGKAYAKFYKRRVGEFGDFVTIDNSAKELGRGRSLDVLLMQASEVEAQEVALTDVRYKSSETIRATTEQLNWLATTHGAAAYERANRPRLMFIPQGGSYGGWAACFESLLTALQIHPLDPEVTVGIPYHYAHLFGPEVYLNMIGLAQFHGLETHLLGWTRDLVTLGEAAKKYPNVRSMDTSRCFVYGKHNLKQLEGYPFTAIKYPGRDPEFFTDPIGHSKSLQVIKNIKQLRSIAHDPVGRSRCHCGSENLAVVNHSELWHDGDIYCDKGHYVRRFDAG